MMEIPEVVRIALANHIKVNCLKAEGAWEYANQDEDTITGDFLGNLRTPGWINLDRYKYRFYYNKTRGRGYGAIEKTIGTDGIITIELENEIGEKTYKSFVFQAKKEKNKVSHSQLEKMNRYFPQNNVIFKYSRNNFLVENFNGSNIRICEFLIEYFLACTFGQLDTYYDSVKNKILRYGNDILYPVPKHTLTINIKK